MQQNENKSVGALYIVATPIGNLKDISYRAVELLQQVDLILVEDTRNAAKLLQHYGIKKPLRALHDHNEAAVSEALIAQIKQGKKLALISDAGTPLVSDPGFRLVRSAQRAGIDAIALPGACAAIAALSIAGLPSDRFAFEGFLPAKTSAREQRLSALIAEPRTLIFYEAKHRIMAFLDSLERVFGADRGIVVARELTKKFESLYHGTINEVIAQIGSDALNQKGEFVVMVKGAEINQEEADLDRVLSILLTELSLKKASKIAAELVGVSKNSCYQRALNLKENT